MTFATAAFPKNLAEIVYMSHTMPANPDPQDDYEFREFIRLAIECGCWGIFREQL